MSVGSRALLQLFASQRTPDPSGHGTLRVPVVPSRAVGGRLHKGGAKLRIIALEEHYATPEFLDGPGRGFMARFADAGEHVPQLAGGLGGLVDKLRDVGAGRIAEMDAAGVDVQVLSLTSPGLEQLPAGEAVAMARRTNDFLAETVGSYPARFAGFAALPTADPPAAAAELERAVDEHGLVGALINGHCRGRRLDDEFFWPILERAEGLGVPIYLHPTLPAQPVIDSVYAGNYSHSVTGIFAMAAWGWHIETATHVLRLILSGAFDRYPALQLIIGHMGEALPFMLPRLNATLPQVITSLQHGGSDTCGRTCTTRSVDSTGPRSSWNCWLR